MVEGVEGGMRLWHRVWMGVDWIEKGLRAEYKLEMVHQVRGE